MESTMPETLNQAIATEPLWLRGWVAVLIAIHLAAVAFIMTRDDGRWRVHYEALAILGSFLLAGMFMNWLYEQVGYVRLLGLAHVVFWTPAYVWILLRRKAIGVDSLFGKYIMFYLVIAGISLVVDAADIVRYLIGDGELLHRWS